MDVGDVTDPNLDGDFQTLLEVRQKRRNKQKTEDVIRLIIQASNHLLERREVVSLHPPELTGESPSLEEAEAIRTALFEAAEQDDVTACEDLTDSIKRLSLSFTDTELRKKDNGSTILHFALEKEKWNFARYLITRGSERLLTDEYKVTVRNVSSKKSCLHILSEKGNYDLTKLLLERLSSSETRKKLLDSTVLMELEGQRPRHLRSMHIAALRGHTNLIELFHGFGVDINVTNNKNDTPVLWAARGNHIETVRFLIKSGANLQLENDKGSTPLYWAVRYGYTDLVEILAREGKANVSQKRKLGLVSPIVLASALGYDDIVKILLDNGADGNLTINNDQTSLHVAAQEGNNEVINVLINTGKVDVNRADCNGNTAILFATKHGHIGTMKILVDSGANIDCKNKMGLTIWDYAMRGQDKHFLKAVVHLYKAAKGIEGQKLSFADGKTPLHIAASNGEVEKMRSLLEMGADPKARDLSGNTSFHVAAKEDRVEVVKEFLSEVDVDDPNYDGDTALHLACKNGHVQTTEVLLQKAKLDTRNELGMTVLHEAVGSAAASPELVQILVDMIVKASNWSVMDAVNRNGNTALHLAAAIGRPEILRELGALNPKITNDEGETPFHIAARSGIAFNLDTMIEIFNKPEKGVDIDQKNNRGESSLHICAQRGDVKSVGMLVFCGADLELKNNDGNCVIHMIIKESVEEPSMKEAMLEVFRGIISFATRWWCMKNDLQYPNEDSEQYYNLLRTAVGHLTSKVFNNKGLNAVTYGISIGAVHLLEEILNTPYVYKFRRPKCSGFVYDITGLIPQTTTDVRNASRKKSSVGVSETINEGKELGNKVIQSIKVSSCLDLVVSLEDEILASKILDIHPFQQLVKNYWKAYQWIYGILMILHVVYMILFTIYVTPSNEDLHSRYNFSRISGCQVGDSRGVYGLFLIWPGILFLYEIYAVTARLLRSRLCACCSGKKTPNVDKTPGNCCSSKLDCSILSMPYLLISTFFSYLGHLTGFAFCGLTVAWYVVYLCPTSMTVYVQILSMVYVVGWLFTLSFTKGFEGMHVYSIIIKYIVIRDIIRFLILYVFILIGCGLGFSVLFQIIPSTDPSYTFSSIWRTFFNVFNLMLGLGELFDISFEETYQSYNGNPGFVRALYIFYITLATVILMSLLVAMMTDTYTDIKAKEGITWKVGSLRLALHMERSIPFIKNFLRATRIVGTRISREESGRWEMSMTTDEIVAATALDAEDMQKTIQRLENKMDRLLGAYVELERRLDSTTSGRDGARPNSVGGARHISAKNKWKTGLFGVVNRLRERQFGGSKTIRGKFA